MTVLPPGPDPGGPTDPSRATSWSSFPGQPGSHAAPAPLEGYAAPPLVDHPSGTTVLVLGVLAFVICPLTGIFAITMGNRALREIDSAPGVYRNRQSVFVGRVLGIVALAVYGVLIALYLLFVLGLLAFFLRNR